MRRVIVQNIINRFSTDFLLIKKNLQRKVNKKLSVSLCAAPSSMHNNEHHCVYLNHANCFLSFDRIKFMFNTIVFLFSVPMMKPKTGSNPSKLSFHANPSLRMPTHAILRRKILQNLTFLDILSTWYYLYFHCLISPVKIFYWSCWEKKMQIMK